MEFYQPPKRNKFISRRKLPDNLKRRLGQFSREGLVVFGPIEVKSYRANPTHYLVQVILHACMEDEQGTRDIYKDLRLERQQRQYK